ncbi:MAG TPA: formate dehydrogenase accessory sulfurtransferase FdhD [Acidimicrobiia bacterium]|jgi:FdhD protein
MTVVKRAVIAVEGARAAARHDDLAEEGPLEIRMASTPLAVLMRTPGADADLALGFALTEGIVLSPDEITDVEPVGDGDRVELRLATGVTVDPERFRRSAYVSSSCGVCGKASIDAVRVAGRRPPEGPALESWMPPRWMTALEGSQPGFARSGGLHAAVVCLPDGTVLTAAEDVGRHNAVDKAIGALARTRWPFGDVVLAVSGRISFEITQKAAVVGIPVVAGVSAASSLAAELGDELGLTVIGFTRGDRFVVYAGADRFAGLD